MIENLRENFLYERLPAALISLDERGLIQAVVGGFQDRLEDLRSYGKKLELFFSVYGLPDPQNNVVSVVLTSPQGKVYKRSLDITPDTPPASNVLGLRQWAANELGLDVATLGTVQYDRDLLRLVDISTLEYLAASIGAILYQSSLAPDVQAANQKLVETYFPRLKIKGTSNSFEVLGRALGFDDIRVTPLWTRLSPRKPEDVGNPVNDPDFKSEPDFWPRQDISVLYDPLAVRDGPFYGWTGTCSNGTASTSYYTSAINGFNPWVSVVVLGSITNGTAAHVAAGSYTLDGGAPNQVAYVEPENSSFRFEAVVEGAAMNGLVITVGTFGANGTDRTVSIYDQLSSVKYRASYFDLGLTVSIDRADVVFGTQPASRNDDIASGSYTMDGVAGTAVSPYRPWVGGSIAVPLIQQDFYTQTVSDSGSIAVRPRRQATSSNQELIVDNLIAAGVQVAQSLEEVRPATRFPRRSAPGLLIDDSAGFASYGTATLMVSAIAGQNVYSGTIAVVPEATIKSVRLKHVPWMYHTWDATIGAWYGVRGIYGFGPNDYKDFPVGIADRVKMDFWMPGSFLDWTVGISLLHIPFSASTANWIITQVYLDGTVGQSQDPYNPDLFHFSNAELQTNGSINAATGTYYWQMWSENWTGAQVIVDWQPVTTEIIRTEPSFADKATGSTAYQLRPEDDDDGLLDEQADDYPWLREIVGGGEQVEVDTYIPEGAPMDVVDVRTAFQNQSGVDVDVYGLNSDNGVLRLRFQDRPYDGNYVPGIRAVGYRGTFKNLAAIDGTDTGTIRPAVNPGGGTYAAKTDFDVLFQPGYEIYHVGVVSNVLVADPVKFYGSHHRTGLVGWMPLNEHPEEALTVIDHARAIPVDVQMLGVAPEDRVWDDERGWHLYLPSGATVSAAVSRGLTDEFAVGCWIKPYTAAGQTRIFQYGPVAIEVAPSGAQVDFLAYDTAGNVSTLASKVVTAGAWTFVALTKTGNSYRVGVGDMTTPVAMSAGFVNTYADFDESASTTLRLAGEVEVHDLRLWKLNKTDDELELARYHAPVQTQVLYPLGFLETANRQDRYGLKVMDSAWVRPDVLPADYRTSRTALVRRYTSDGSYVGASRFKEVGLGGGHTLPSVNQLGYAVPTIEVGGTAVTSGSWGALPGVNNLWAQDTTTLFPMDQCNPVRDRIWVRGVDNQMYEVTMFGSSVNNLNRTLVHGDAFYAGTNIFGHNSSYAGTSSQQLTGAEVVIASGGNKVFWSGGTLVQVADPGGTSTPPQWLYLHKRVTDQYPGSVSTWTKNGFTANQQHVDITGNPGMVSVSGNPDSALLVAALGENGRLDFENRSSLSPARYRLSIDSGNIGPTDEDFTGFTVELNLNENIIETVLLRDQSGFNVRGTDVIEFVTNTPPVTGIGSSWLLSISWFNALRDTSKGTMRQLAIYGYKLERLSTEIYQISANPNPGATRPEIRLVASGTQPGGWLSVVNSYGTVVSQMHEGTVYPSNDTLTSKLPLADLLTSVTNDKREDIIVTHIEPPSFLSSGTVLSDPAPLVMPTFDYLVDQPL